MRLKQRGRNVFWRVSVELRSFGFRWTAQDERFPVLGTVAPGRFPIDQRTGRREAWKPDSAAKEENDGIVFHGQIQLPPQFLQGHPAGAPKLALQLGESPKEVEGQQQD